MGYSIYTKDEIITKIKNIDEAMSNSSGIKEYSVSDGQGSQTVKKQDLKALQELRAYWENKLKKIDPNYGGIAAYKIGVNL